MSRLEWNESLSVRNADIDEQHKQWIAIHNRLHDALTTGTFDYIEKTAAETLKAMQEYARYHFEFEEKYMKNIHYPEIVEHRRLHRDFDDLIYTYNRDSLAGKAVLRSEIMKVLKNWFLGHIQHEDQKICRFFNDATQKT